jgi:D-serine deaminase-like pyridoxal phosphate-dependent protein
MAITRTNEQDRAPFSPNALTVLATPCLIVDGAALERNLRRAAEFFATRKVKLRPHFKAHKCTTLMRRQLAAGSCVGVTCATAAEALVLADAGFDDVLVANQVADSHALRALAAAARLTHVMVAVDSLVHVEMLESVAAREGVTFEVLIEVDVGLHRCGLPPGSADLLVIAEGVTRADRLTLAGLQGYEGHAVFVRDRAERRQLVERAGELLAAERARLLTAGFDCRLVSGGGSGTYDLAAEAGVLDEVQAGSYALMDARYGGLDLPFEQALYCLATIISSQGEGAVVDAGLKALSAEYGLPQPSSPDIEAIDFSDEHLQLTLSGDVAVTVGERVTLIPGHVDPTVNLHDTLFVVAGDAVHAWPVDGRRISSWTRAGTGE